MEEIKVNMENLSDEERKQLLTLIEKANDTAKKIAEKKKLLDKVKENLINFYGDNVEKLRKHISVFERTAEVVINDLVDKGYKVSIVPGMHFKTTMWDSLASDTVTDEVYCSIRDVYNNDDNIVDYITSMNITTDYILYIYLPLYKDLNDNTYKSCWTFRYDKRLPQKGVWSDTSLEPKDGEIYYYVADNGKINKLIQRHLRLDNQLYELGNCFKNEEDAEFALQRQKIIVGLERFARKHNNPKEIPTWELFYDASTDKVMCCKDAFYNNHITGSIKFTEDVVVDVLHEFDSESLKKYYFRIKGNQYGQI